MIPLKSMTDRKKKKRTDSNLKAQIQIRVYLASTTKPNDMFCVNFILLDS